MEVGGGGGAGSAGENGTPTAAGNGVTGVRITFAGPTGSPSLMVGYPGPGSGAAATGWVAGGGGGSAPSAPKVAKGGGPGGPYAGAGDGIHAPTQSSSMPNAMAKQNSGSGGGGTRGGEGRGGAGGSGVCIV